METALPQSEIGLPYDCEPTLDDEQIFEFCRKGYLALEGVVDDDVNERTMAYCDDHPTGQPLELLDEDWFVDGVLKNPTAAGAVRCLLGENFQLPANISNHRVQCPEPAQGWHRDGGSIYTPRLDYLQVFYYPQDTKPEMGPTEVLPGSHFRRCKSNFINHIRNIKMTEKTTAPAGTIFITVYAIWHRKGKSTWSGIRNLIKYNYWRTADPRRDWIVNPDYVFSWPETPPEPGFEQFKSEIGAARMFAWLCGEEYEHVGGQCWPCGSPRTPACDQPGLPEGLRRYK